MKITKEVRNRLKGTFLANKPGDEIIRKIKEDSRWNILANDDTLFNPLFNLPDEGMENFPKYVSYLMSHPDYFYLMIRLLFAMDTYPMQCLLLREMFNHRFPLLIGSRGMAKTSTLALYTIIRMITIPGTKGVITGAGFRQAKLVFDYIETIWNNSPALRSVYKGGKNGPIHGADAWSFRLGRSVVYALPIGHDGSKIRGFRANFLISDEFASVNKTVFEEVISPFLSVSSDVIGQMEHESSLSTFESLGIETTEEDRQSDIIQNQLILSGTAYYKFNHFYEYFQKWHNVLMTAGDQQKLQDIFGEDGKTSTASWKDYSIIRIPVELVPAGFLDKSQIDRIRTHTSKDVYLREYGACFVDDSDGFYKQSLIQNCTVSNEKKIIIDEKEVKFPPMLYGDATKKYVFGVDPAYEGDNFAIVVLEVEPHYRKVVHVWTTQSNDHKQRLKDGIITEVNYFYYCARKIRDLMKRFPCSFIAMDTFGGGKAVMEALRDPTRLNEGERPILPVKDLDNKPVESDFIAGDHILHIITPTTEWNETAYHDLKKDMEAQTILFPFHDNLTAGIAEYYDESLGESKTLYDTLGDCVYEIEELKKELTTIMIVETPGGRTKFVVAGDQLTTGRKKGDMKKDRVSALIMANYIARNFSATSARPINPDVGTLHGFVNKTERGVMYYGRPEIAEKLSNLYRNV
jgi:hypothetical protein